MVNLQQYSKEQLKEMSFLELAYLILAEKREPMSFKELLSEIQGYLEVSDNEVQSRMVQFYTDLNVDGSFLGLGENRWGLRAWYPVEKLEEETTNAPVKTRKKKAKKAVEEDFDEDIIDEDDDLDEFEEEDFEEVEDDLDIDEDDIDEVEDELEEVLDVEIDADIEEDDDDFEEEEGAEDEYDLDDK